MKSLFYIVPLFFAHYSSAQKRVHWFLDFNSDVMSLRVTGEIDEGWHLYSVKTDPNAGPIPVQIKTKKIRGLKSKGKFIEKTSPIKTFDANFDSDVFIFEKKYCAEQKIKLRKKTCIEVTVNYMICNDKMCLPPKDEVLSIKLN